MSNFIFLKLDGIKGESFDERHKDEISVDSFSWAISHGEMGDTGPSGAVAHANLPDIHIIKVVDRSSPELMLACFSSRQIKAGVITVRRAGGEYHEYLKIKLNDIIVSSVRQEAGRESCSEAVTLTFAQVQMEYQGQSPSGSPEAAVMTGWDLRNNRGA
jgi:type VI secretion system secreted protein Hcp